MKKRKTQSIRREYGKRFILGKFGWDTRFCDLTEKQVHTLLFGIQESKPITGEVKIGELEETYYESTGTWPLTSIPF